MHEPDDRLVGDPVWELFPAPTEARPSRRIGRWVTIAVVVAAAWVVAPSLAVVVVCLAASIGEFREGRRLRRAIPEKAGGDICALFRYAWGAWKIGCTAFGLLFVVAMLPRGPGSAEDAPPGVIAVGLLWFAGFAASAALTATGLLKALRSGMRVWIGEGVNRARTLLLGMLLVGFTAAVLFPLCVVIAAAHDPGADDGGRGAAVFIAGFVACQFVGPVLILVLLDWFSRRVLADRPGKFGPKVPAVGKWDR